MANTDPTRPVFIKATNVDGLTMTNNTVIGDADFAELENVTNLTASGNAHITPDTFASAPTKRWFEKPFGIVFLGLVVTVVGGGLLYIFGWN